MNFRGKRIAVIGLGIEGTSVVKYFQEKEVTLTIFDQKKEKDLNFSGIDKNKVEVKSGENYLSGGLKNYDVIFRSQGVKRYLPQILEAEKKGVEVSSEIKLFFDLAPSKIIGVTGTKGKGTTSTLIYQILKCAGKDVYLAGNIGVPRLNLLPNLRPSSWVVLELSSTQLIDLHKSPHIAVVLNITTDHLDWHKDRAEYVAAKANIVKHQTKGDFAILNYDYKDPRDFSNLTHAKKFYFSKSQKVKGSFVLDNKLYLNTAGKAIEIGKTKDLLLRGEHNWENVTAAMCASSLSGAETKSIRDTVFTFEGLEHRLELVYETRKVKFYNDSFSTNPQTTIAAIHSFEEPLTLILGGSDKGLNYDEMGREIAVSNNVINVVLIGAISRKIKNSIEKAGYKGTIVDFGKLTMKDLTKKCFELTPKGGVVLLSPATASFDMFADYKDRGNQFKAAVKLLRDY